MTISVKTVNHRGLDLHFYTGSGNGSVRSAMRSAIKKHVGARAHRHSGATRFVVRRQRPLTWTSRRLEAYMAALQGSLDAVRPRAKPDLNAAFRIPGILERRGRSRTARRLLKRRSSALLEQALHDLNEFRAREGAELGRR